MKIRSFAKINLGIEVLRKREDGYHDIRTLFQAIDLFDIIEFQVLPDGEIQLDGTAVSVPWDEKNLIYQAAEILKTKFQVHSGIKIAVVKSIPPGMGLGGGSSNAAMTLYALNKLWDLGLGRKALLELGKKIGADVPFFLEGGLCLGEGRGDDLTPLPDLPPLFCALLFPPFSISTGSVYGSLRVPLTSQGKESKIIKFLTGREFGLLENSLEKTVFSLYPRLKEIKKIFLKGEAVLSLVSGSGSAVFGLFEERAEAERTCRKLGGTGEALVVEALSRRRYWKRVQAGV